MRFESLLLSKAPLPVIAKCKKCLIYAHSVSIGEKRGHSCTMEILAFYAVKKTLAEAGLHDWKGTSFISHLAFGTNLEIL